MKTFTDTIHCRQRRACKDCRSSQRFRDSIRAVYAVPADFDQRCPYGVSAENLKPTKTREAILAEIKMLEGVLSRMRASKCKNCELQVTIDTIEELKLELEGAPV